MFSDTTGIPQIFMDKLGDFTYVELQKNRSVGVPCIEISIYCEYAKCTLIGVRKSSYLCDCNLKQLVALDNTNSIKLLKSNLRHMKWYVIFTQKVNACVAEFTARNIKNIFAVLSFVKTETVQIAPPSGRQDRYILQSQYLACWWQGNTRISPRTFSLQHLKC